MTWCITALILCLDTSHRASVDKPQYTRAYLSLKGGFSGVFFGTGLCQQLAVKPITHLVLIFLQLVFFFLFALLQSWTNTWVIMALFLSLVSLFRNNSNNNNNNNNSLKLIHEIKTTYLMLQNFQFKLSEVKINTELLYTILSEHLI